ncbi:hypothetical protein AGOR_G00103420 [Albula goreensis]|uniref:Potassium channel domain-containing protein n=1 Tax=Albula goreensis TaxID=1534307 RepID=A0A8T3DJF2_9TELE|nr:hypothetical protein AGOR_G00103420 [Albula goreensis]
MLPPLRCFPCLPAKLPSILLLGLIYVAYVLTGGAIFWKLEGGAVEEELRILRVEVDKLHKRFPCLRGDNIDAVAEILQRASKSGLSIRHNQTTDGFWKFTSSAVFAATVVTTIGYGNISPSTTVGQIFCVFFAIIGIPLNVVVLNRIGKYMLSFNRMTCDFIERKISPLRCIRVLIHILAFAMGLVLFFVVPMLVFKMHEGWTYSQAIYYCFITLSTIGFGDYVADNNPEKTYPEWYGSLLGVWIFFGLAWLALLINHGIDILENANTSKKGDEGGSNDPNGPEEQPAGETSLNEVQTTSEEPKDSGETEKANEEEEEPQK